MDYKENTLDWFKNLKDSLETVGYYYTYDFDCDEFHLTKILCMLYILEELAKKEEQNND